MISIYNNIAYHYTNTVIKIEYLTHIMICADHISNIDIRLINIKRWFLNNKSLVCCILTIGIKYVNSTCA